MNFLNSRQAARDSQADRVREVAPGAVLVEIPVNNGPISSIAASHDGTRLMVTNYGRDSVSVIDTDTYRVLETMDRRQRAVRDRGGQRGCQPCVRQHRVSGV